MVRSEEERIRMGFLSSVVFSIMGRDHYKGMACGLSLPNKYH
jgi:hypothetical protein